jgi:hypothetical protein
MHSCRLELERAMEVLWPKEVISMTDCHTSEVMSKRPGMHHVDGFFAASIQVMKIQQEEVCSRIHSTQKQQLEVGSDVLGSSKTYRAKKKTYQEKFQKKTYG